MAYNHQPSPYASPYPPSYGPRLQSPMTPVAENFGSETAQHALLKAMDLNDMSHRPHRANPLHISTFQLMQQPNGGHGRILIKVKPHALPEEAPVVGRPTVYSTDEELMRGVAASHQGHALTVGAANPPNAAVSQQAADLSASGGGSGVPADVFRPLASPSALSLTVKPFWHRTNEGDITCFDIDFARLKRQFGVSHGERVLSTWGPTAGAWSTVIGVRNGCLWVKDDGAAGAMALAGLNSREAIESALGWVSHGSQLVEPTTSVQVPVLSFDKTRVELRRLACDPHTMALCFGEGRFHGSVHVVTSLPFESTSDDALLFVPVGVDTTTGDLVAFLAERSQSDLSATLMGGMGGGVGGGLAAVPDTVLRSLLFGSTRTLPLNRSAVTPSLVFASVLEGVQNPEGVTALLRPERILDESQAAALLGGGVLGPSTLVNGRPLPAAMQKILGTGKASDAVLAEARSKRARAAVPLLEGAAKITSHEGHATFLAYRGEPLPISLFTGSASSITALALPQQAAVAIRQPSLQFYYRPISSAAAAKRAGV